MIELSNEECHTDALVRVGTIESAGHGCDCFDHHHRCPDFLCGVRSVYQLIHPMLDDRCRYFVAAPCDDDHSKGQSRDYCSSQDHCRAGGTDRGLSNQHT